MNDSPPKHNEEQHEVEIDEFHGEVDDGPGEKSSVQPLPGGEVQAPRDRFVLTNQTGRLFVQELVRAGIAFSFIVLFAVVIVLAFEDVKSKSWANAREALEILVPTLSALIGSATGFYFGTRR